MKKNALLILVLIVPAFYGQKNLDYYLGEEYFKKFKNNDYRFLISDIDYKLLTKQK